MTWTDGARYIFTWYVSLFLAIEANQMENVFQKEDLSGTCLSNLR